MSLNDDYDKNKLNKARGEQTEKDGEKGTGSGKGGQGGHIEFRDFTTSKQHIRDDMLPGDEKIKLANHSETHEGRVEKQKNLREQRDKLRKEGKKAGQNYQQGFGNDNKSQYRANPLLATAAQFSGVDKQESPLPSNNEANTNEGDRDRLNNEYQLRYSPKNAPVLAFNPKPIHR